MKTKTRSIVPPIPEKPTLGQRGVKFVASGIPCHCAFSEIADIASLVPNPRNPNKHGDRQIALLAKIIKHQGWRSPIVVSRRSGFVVAGHGRLDAAKLLQVEKVPVDYQDFATEADEWAHLVADNKIAELAEIDEKELAAILTELKAADTDLDLAGFDAEELSTLNLGLENEIDAEPQIDKAAELQAKWKTERGQIWQLGEHRLMCGDCRESADVGALFPISIDRTLINLAFTSPPYAAQRDYDESSGFKPIPPDEFVEWFEPVQQGVKSHLTRDGSWFVNIKPSADGLDTSLYVFDLVIAHVRRWGWHFATEYCWERNGVPKCVTRRFKNQFEPIYQFALNDWKMRPESVQHPSDNVPIPFGKGAGQTSWKDKQGGNGAMFGGQKWQKRAANNQGNEGAVDRNASAPGMAYPGNRLPTFNASHEATGHTAAFPVGLPSFFIKAYTDEGDTIYEPFSGSGTTIIACERLNRKCRAMEISPAYVAVAIQRWADATGKEPKLLNG